MHSPAQYGRWPFHPLWWNTVTPLSVYSSTARKAEVGKHTHGETSWGVRIYKALCTHWCHGGHRRAPCRQVCGADSHTCPTQVSTPGFIELCLPSEADVWPTGHRHTEVSTGVSLLCISQRGKQQSEHLQNHYREKHVKSECLSLDLKGHPPPRPQPLVLPVRIVESSDMLFDTAPPNFHKLQY